MKKKASLEKSLLVSEEEEYTFLLLCSVFIVLMLNTLSVNKASIHDLDYTLQENEK